jgi:hypothetical protein
MRSRDFPETESVNCQACGSEHYETELRIARIGSMGAMSVCKSCFQKTAEASFQSAAELLDEIVFIARATGTNPERRLREIKILIEG